MNNNCNLNLTKNGKINSAKRILRILYSICKSQSGIIVSELAKEYDISVPLVRNYIKNLKVYI